MSEIISATPVIRAIGVKINMINWVKPIHFIGNFFFLFRIEFKQRFINTLKGILITTGTIPRIIYIDAYSDLCVLNIPAQTDHDP